MLSPKELLKMHFMMQWHNNWKWKVKFLLLKVILMCHWVWSFKRSSLKSVGVTLSDSLLGFNCDLERSVCVCMSLVYSLYLLLTLSLLHPVSIWYFSSSSLCFFSLPPLPHTFSWPPPAPELIAEQDNDTAAVWKHCIIYYAVIESFVLNLQIVRDSSQL